MIFSRGGFWQKLLAAIALFGITLAPAVAAGPASVEPAEISARPLPQFRIGNDEKHFGPVAFLGGVEMPSPPRAFG
ncbi:hypothetical protein NKI14_24795, partial [Mesorhizobium sp. M0767]